MFSKRLLVIAPHFKVFIRDQLEHVKQAFDRIFVVIPKPYFSELVLKLPYASKYFTFLEYSSGSFTNKLDEKCEMYEARYFTLPMNTLRNKNSQFVAKSCVKTLLKNGIYFDLVHVHFLSNGLAGTCIKERFDKSLIITTHGYDVYDLPFRSKWYKRMSQFILKKADQIIAVSKRLAEKLLSLAPVSNKLHVIPNGYNEKLFKPIPQHIARKKLSLPQEKKIILTVGNLVPVKGHTFLIDAAYRIVRKNCYDDVLFVVVGNGSLRRMLEKKTKALGLNDRIVFTGYRKHYEIPLWMNACDIFVLPSLIEGFSEVVVEALACGKPVVATDVGAVPEIVCSSELGIIIPPMDPESLSWAIIDALNKKWDPEIILKHIKRYSWSEISKEILSVYQKILEDVELR